MTEERTSETAEPEAAFEAGAAALTLALDGARYDPRLRGPITAFLKAQRELIADQRLHLHEQFRNLKLRDVSERLKVGLQVLTVLVGVLVLAGLAAMAWRASRADGLVVEAFSVPPEIARQGVTGAVLAETLLDRLAQLDRASDTFTTLKVSDAWTGETRIEIPETGVSLNEVDRLLRRWLGHETHLSGDLVVTPAGLRLTARTAFGETAEAEGAAATLPALTQTVAEGLFARARPAQYASLLMRRGRDDLAEPILKQLLASAPSPMERARSSMFLGIIYLDHRRWAEARRMFEGVAATADPLRRMTALENLAGLDQTLGRTAAAVSESAQGLAWERRATFGSKGLDEAALAFNQGQDAYLHGAFLDGARRLARAPLNMMKALAPGFYEDTWALALAALHQSSQARLAGPNSSMAQAVAARSEQAWPQVLASLDAGDLHANFAGTPLLDAWRIEALTGLARLDEARVLAARTPPDCVDCLIARAGLAEAGGDRPGADRLYAEAIRQAPAAPFAYYAQGKTRLARGDLAGASDSARLASKAGPGFADPLALAGEIAMRRGDAAGAAVKFQAAVTLAPGWGGARLMWADALARLGQTRAAEAQWLAAAGLDLTAEERKLLNARMG